MVLPCLPQTVYTVRTTGVLSEGQDPSSTPDHVNNRRVWLRLFTCSPFSAEKNAFTDGDNIFCSVSKSIIPYPRLYLGYRKPADSHRKYTSQNHIVYSTLFTFVHNRHVQRTVQGVSLWTTANLIRLDKSSFLFFSCF